MNLSRLGLVSSRKATALERRLAAVSRELDAALVDRKAAEQQAEARAAEAAELTRNVETAAAYTRDLEAANQSLDGQLRATATYVQGVEAGCQASVSSLEAATTYARGLEAAIAELQAGDAPGAYARGLESANAELAANLEAILHAADASAAYARGLETANRTLQEIGDSLAARLAAMETLARDLERANAEQVASLHAAGAYARTLEAATLDQDRQIGELRRRTEGAEAERLRLQAAGISRDDVQLLHDSLISRFSILSSGLGDVGRLLRRAESGGPAAGDHLRTQYLDLLEGALVGRIYRDGSISPWAAPDHDAGRRLMGRDWPSHAHTMIGTARMRNIRELASRILEDGVAGDFLEAGVWRGGACIYMRGILAAHGVSDRRVWVADSFAGLPPPEADRFPVDAGDRHHEYAELAVSLDQVQQNFANYGLLDDRVVFLPGWFKDTLPKAEVETLALLRLDGDMYSSTIDTLDATYHKVPPGGFVIVDDYILRGARAAVDDFRDRHAITDPVEPIDGAAVFWRKGG